MKIMHLNQFGQNYGGAEAYIADASAVLARAGHESHLVYFEGDSEGNLIPNTTCATEQATGYTTEQARQVIQRLVEERNFDVALTHVIYDSELLSWLPGRLPTVGYVHAPYVVCPGHAYFLRRSGRVCNQAAGTICLANAQRERCFFGRNPLKNLHQLRAVLALRKAYSQLPIIVNSRFMKELLIKNGIGASNIHILSPVMFSLPLEPVARPSNYNTLLFVGRVIPEKGLNVLIEALSDIDEPWRLLVLGDGPAVPECEALALRLGIADRIEWLGWRSQTETSAYFQQSSIVVVPSLWPEPYGRIGAEAFAHGRPVVAFDVGGIREWLHDGVTGFLAKPNDTGSLRRQLKRLLESPEKQHSMGTTAYNQVSKRWSQERHVGELIQILAKAKSAYSTVLE